MASALQLGPPDAAVTGKYSALCLVDLVRFPRRWNVLVSLWLPVLGFMAVCPVGFSGRARLNAVGMAEDATQAGCTPLQERVLPATVAVDSICAGIGVSVKARARGQSCPTGNAVSGDATLKHPPATPA